MGRKKNEIPKRKGYFYEEQEQAVLDYLNEPDPILKDRIFADKFGKKQASVIPMPV